MAKLKDDEIKWILDIDAKGVQGELKKFASAIDDLQQKNKVLNETIKEQKKALYDSEKELNMMIKTGKHGTKEFTDLASSIDSIKNNLGKMEKEVDDNKKAIDNQNKAYQETIKTMSVSDMTMNQLIKRSSELRKQLNNTSASLSPEAYAALSKELDEVRSRMSVVGNSNNSLIQSLSSIRGPVGLATLGIVVFVTAL